MPTILTAGWIEDQQKWLEQHREKRDTNPQSLILEKTKQWLQGAKDKIIKHPGTFLKSFNTISKDLDIIINLKNVKENRTELGIAERLKHAIVDFINNFTAKIRKGDANITVGIQKSLVENAAEFDKEGIFVQKLCSTFDEKYGETYEKEKAMQQARLEGTRRKFEAASILRKIASVLKKLAT